MRWFKHYSDMHQGRSINYLLDKVGHTGLCFFLLQEMCVQKMDKKKGEVHKESDFIFNFHPRVVRTNLRISQAKLQRLLSHSQEVGLLDFKFTKENLEIKMPILLNLLDRDTRKARQRRANDAAKTVLEREREREIDVGTQQQIKEINSYLEQTLGSQVGEIQRYSEEILTTYKSSDNFKDWIEGLINNNTKASKDNPDYIRYIRGAILRSIGVIKAAND